MNEKLNDLIKKVKRLYTDTCNAFVRGINEMSDGLKKI